MGKLKEIFWEQAIDEYKKRLSRFAELKIIEVEEATKFTNLDQKSKTEGELLLAKSTGIVVALDGGGKMMSSPEIAEFIRKKEIQI